MPVCMRTRVFVSLVFVFLTAFSFAQNALQYRLWDGSEDSLSFSGIDDTVRIDFDGSRVSVRNPFAFNGVSVDVTDAEVCIRSSIDQKGLVYVLSGASPDGTCSIYSEKSFELMLNGLQLNHTDGPAMNIQSKKAAYITLKEGSNNVLSDGISYQETDEDQKACLFSEGQLIFQGTGTLHVYGRGSDQHAICSDDYIDVLSGTIVVHSSVKDGMHCNDGFWLRGGSLEIQSSGDGIDTDRVLVVSGGVCPCLLREMAARRSRLKVRLIFLVVRCS